MNKKGRVVIALVLGVAVLAAFTLAYAKVKAPDKPLTIDTKDVYKKKKKTPVVFPHAAHKALKCQKCHHTWKEGEAVKKCGACHKEKKDKKSPGLKKAFHNQCQKCHKAYKKEKKKTGPTSCTKCHPKKK